jgi:hypothetical protein
MRVHSLLVAVTVALVGCSRQSPVQPSNAAPGDAGQVTTDPRLGDADQQRSPCVSLLFACLSSGRIDQFERSESWRA